MTNSKIIPFSRSGIYVLLRKEPGRLGRFRIGSGVFADRIPPRQADGFVPQIALAFEVDRDTLYSLERSLHWIVGSHPRIKRDGSKEEFICTQDAFDYFAALFKPVKSSWYRCINKEDGEHVYYRNLADAVAGRDGGSVYAEVCVDGTAKIAASMKQALATLKANNVTIDTGGPGFGHFRSVIGHLPCYN